MIPDTIQLVYDRTNQDLAKIKSLLKKPKKQWTEDDKAYYDAASSKGSYNYTDLNRVTKAIEYFVDIVSGYGYDPKYEKIKIEHPNETILVPDSTIKFLLKSADDSIVDGSENAVSVSVKGNVKVDSSAGLFGEPAIKFGGTSDDYLTIPKLDLSGEWTLEWWENRTTVKGDNGGAIVHTDDGNGGMIVARENRSKVLGIFASSTESSPWDSIAVTNIGTAEQDVWVFRAVVCDGKEVRVYKDGVKTNTIAYNSIPYSGSYWLIGKRYSYSGINGLVQDLRFSTVARYNEDFDVPDGPLLAGEIKEPDESKDPYTWYESDEPSLEQLEQYLLNVRNLCATVMQDFLLPESMRKLSIQDANSIERIFIDLDTVIERVVKSMCRSNAFTFWSGNRPLPSADSDLGRTWEELDAMNVPWENLETADWFLLAYGNLGVTK